MVEGHTAIRQLSENSVSDIIKKKGVFTKWERL